MSMSSKATLLLVTVLLIAIVLAIVRFLVHEVVRFRRIITAGAGGHQTGAGLAVSEKIRTAIGQQAVRYYLSMKNLAALSTSRAHAVAAR